METQTDTGLAAQLRTGTAEAHEAAENEPFARGLVDGTVALEGYIALLGQLRHVYRALEAPAEALRSDPLVAPFVDPRLHRHDAILTDLAALGAPLVDPRPVTAAYAERITTAAATWPVGWVAHHYTRYLGDLSGGRILGHAIRKHFGLAEGAGTSFFEFPEIGAPVPYKRAYRDRLDALGAALTAAERSRLLAESAAAFTANQSLFADLARSAP